jgi:prevent-host-death family protein
MSEMTVSEARDRLADAIDRARTSHEPVVLTRRGRRVAVLVDADDFARMSDLVEDALDRAELEAAGPRMTTCPGSRSRPTSGSRD